MLSSASATLPLNCRFAVISDLHIALPETIANHPSRFHLVEVSIPSLELILERLSHLDLDFLLLPGDLTQHGEPANHTWLAQRLAQLPYPAYVIPGNHDVPVVQADGTSIAAAAFPQYYRQFGYDQLSGDQLSGDQLSGDQLSRDQFGGDQAPLPYYTQELLPGLRLIGLNSNQFDMNGKQIGRVDAAQFAWLQSVLTAHPEDLILVMIHHNVVEHLPDQSQHPLGRRYMLENAVELRSLLQQFGVELVFTGHLHVQDIAYSDGLYDITTGSLVSYPHPYRVMHLQTDAQGQRHLHIQSGRVETVPGWEDLQALSREWMGARSHPFILKLLTSPPLHLDLDTAENLLPHLRNFWADIADGDRVFDFAQFPPAARQYFERFGAIAADGTVQAIDNTASLRLGVPR